MTNLKDMWRKFSVWVSGKPNNTVVSANVTPVAPVEVVHKVEIVAHEVAQKAPPSPKKSRKKKKV